MGIFCLDQRMSNDETNKLTIFKDDNEFEEFDREGKWFSYRLSCFLLSNSGLAMLVE